MTASLLLTLALACGDKPIEGTDGDGGDGGDGTSGPECTEDSECADYEICESESCIDGDRNNDIDEAETVLWDDEDGTQGYLNPEQDVDYYAFGADGGEFVRIRTVHEYGEQGGDTVITLRSPSGKVVTFSDDYPNGGSTTGADSTIYAYLASAGTYTVEVQDRSTYYDLEEPIGDKDFAYTLTLETWNLHTDDTDAADDPSVELTFDAANSYTAIGALLETPGDSDFIAIQHGISDAELVVYGVVDLTGSDADPSVRLWSDGEEVLLDRQGLTDYGYAAYPYLPSGDYVLELYDADGDGGDNHWFFVFPIFFELDGAYPIETEPNDSKETADVLDMTEATTGSGNAYAFGQGTGYVDATLDEDWYRVEARSDAELVVCVSSAVSGSLVTPSVEVYDGGGSLVASGSGSASTQPNASVEDVTMGSGDYYVRIFDEAGEYTGGGAYYRFVVYTADFDVSSYDDGGYSCPR
ncbi:MAG: hypothetical protein H6742_17295 [Alphaproteobacteria bacterium]|nr:hypothetical protein [Alphaproteobacteria bacterium]